MGRIRVGTSGWSYPRWRGDFYPVGLRQRDELAYAAARMSSVEINASFYSLQRPSSYLAWRAATPGGFVLAVKGSRFITHMKKLAGVETALANFFASGVLALEDRLGPVLWQLPESLPYDEARVSEFFGLLPRSTSAAAELARQHDARVSGDRAVTDVDRDRPVRHVVEFRHRSFCDPAVIEFFRRHDVGVVMADTAGRWPEVREITSQDVYVRLHGDRELYRSAYSEQSLTMWAERCRRWAVDHDVWVYFDNDADGHAPHDALSLSTLLDLPPSLSSDVSAMGSKVTET